MQAHADADQREADAVVGVVLSEQVVHHERADREQPERDGGGERRDREHRHADRARERVVPRGRLEAR